MFDKISSDLAIEISKIPPHDAETGEVLESAFLTKYVVLAEWMDADGNKYLVRRYATGSGENLPIWDYKGILHEGLFGF